MAVTSKEGVDRGRPSSWSGALDKISFGDSENKKLFIVSSGNILNNEDWQVYPDSTSLHSVQNPSQSWNALVVGAYTEKVILDDMRYQDYTSLAPSGGISPFNSSSIYWNKKWPIKPDIVFEGGNLLYKESDGIRQFDFHEDLEVLTTSKNIATKQFDTINGTSSATAQASWLAAKIAYRYPNIWPETIRGLLVHSAKWTDEMISQLNIDLNSKRSVNKLLRTVGYGVPDINRTLNSYENGFTLISEETIQPYKKESGTVKTNEMHFYEFPWPKDELLQLGDVEVKMRITLTYFIEPGPGEIGWKDKYRYASHGLRFDVNNIGETETEFKKRINKAAREENENMEFDAGSSRWTIGKGYRSSGAIHSDIWGDTAANISDCNYIAVYPVIGWWKQRTNLKQFNDKTRYALIVSLETPEEAVQLYSTIKNLISTTIEIDV